MINLRSLVVSAGRFLSGVKMSKVNLLSIQGYEATPLPVVFAPSYPPETAYICYLFFLVFAVLEMRALANVPSAIVQGIMIFVVAFFFWRTSKYFSVHGQAFTSTFPFADFVMNSPRGIERFQFFIELSKPIPLRKRLEVLCVNNRSLSLCQSDESERLIERLSNGVPLLRLSGHESSLKDFWYSAILT